MVEVEKIFRYFIESEKIFKNVEVFKNYEISDEENDHLYIIKYQLKEDYLFRNNDEDYKLENDYLSNKEIVKSPFIIVMKRNNFQKFMLVNNLFIPFPVIEEEFSLLMFYNDEGKKLKVESRYKIYKLMYDIHYDLIYYGRYHFEYDYFFNNIMKAKRINHLSSFLTAQDYGNKFDREKSWITASDYFENLYEEYADENMMEEAETFQHINYATYQNFKRYDYIPTKAQILTLTLHLGLSKIKIKEVMNEFGYFLTKNIAYDKIVLEYLEQNNSKYNIEKLNDLLLDENNLRYKKSLKNDGINAIYYNNTKRHYYLIGPTKVFTKSQIKKLNQLKSLIDKDVYEQQLSEIYEMLEEQKKNYIKLKLIK